MANIDTQASPQATKSAPDGPRGFIAEWTVTILILVFGTTWILQPFVVPSGSMESTVLIGDHLIVDKLAYSPVGSASGHVLPYEPVHRGDIIVFKWPPDIRQNYVKRAVGLPGDHIRLERKQLYINGKAVNEPYTQHITDFNDSYRDNFPSYPNVRLFPAGEKMLKDNVVNGEVVVPPGYYFALGDNRDNSQDSRYWGFVPRENIVGKPVLIYWSYDAPTENLIAPGISLDHFLDLVQHFFTKTRWSRTFKLVRGYNLQAP